MPVPSQSDVAETRTKAVLEAVREIIQAGGLETFTRIIEHETEGDLNTVEIAAALLKMQMEERLEAPAEKRDDVDFADTGAEVGMVRFFLAVGRQHKVAPKDIVGAIAGETGIPGKAIGAIRILDSYSFVEIPKENANEVYTIMKERTIRNQPTGIEPAAGKRAY
jgi:ATP-dependent RNA helicase DeaD